MIGFAIGLALENKYVGFSEVPEGGQKWKLAIRIIVGLVIVLILLVGLKALLPMDDVLIRSARYALVTFVGIFVWPFIFKKANL